MATLLGTSVSSGDDVLLSSEGRRQGTYVVGLNGTGKTTLLCSIALADMAEGHGVCVLDPHGDMTEDLLSRIPQGREKDVILFDPADVERPFGFNLFECQDPSDPMEVDLVCSEVVGTFYKLFAYSWGPQMEDLLRNTTLTLIESPGSTMADIPRLLTDREYRAGFETHLSNQEVADFWAYTYNPLKIREQLELNRSSLNKIRRFLLNGLIRNIVGQEHSSLDLRLVMDTSKILLVNLAKGKIGEENSRLLGSLLVGKILLAALSRSELPREERVPFHLIVDEYHSFATESFPTLQAEARKFAIDTICAHQYRDQLDLLNQGSTLNVGNVVFFRVSGKDASELATMFDNTPEEPELEREPMLYPTSRAGVYRGGDKAEYVMLPGKRRLYSDVQSERANHLANLANYTACGRLVDGQRLCEYEFASLPMPGLPEPEKVGIIREHSRNQYGRERSEVEAFLKKRGASELPQRTRYD